MASTTVESEIGGATDIKVLLVTYPAWPPFKCGRQGRAIVANQAST